MNPDNPFELIVVGAGHAGVEAATAAARMGGKTLLLTQNIETLGQMSCNPAIGGIGKSHLVKEVDALGGVMARATDQAGIHFRVLNASKGPAVRATRAQADRGLYRSAVRTLVENQENLHLFQQQVDDLLVENGQVAGVLCQMGLKIRARAVVLTVGTFLGGRIFIGESGYQGGRAGDSPSNKLSDRLRELSLPTLRLKTGTPPRIDGRSIDYSQLREQPGDSPRPVMSYLGRAEQHPRQMHCHITRTTAATHQLIRDSLHRSPMYSGKIEGIGPRYCPSIEDKVMRFAERDHHQIFVEPEGLNTHEVYPNGISTSLPYDVQQAFVRTIAGFERAHITRPGYAIEYDFFDPRGLHPWLETRQLPGLFFAGQINGTTGYEEAAAQGIVAGINAALCIREQDCWWPRRSEAYIGVLIDDLVTRGVTEPYRMFTSRAEYRLTLREDNADLRLTETGRTLGLVDDYRWARFVERRDAVREEKQRLGNCWIKCHEVDQQLAERVLGAPLSRNSNMQELLRRPGVTWDKLQSLSPAPAPDLSADVTSLVETDIKYAGYLERQRLEIQRQQANETTALPADLDYTKVHGLSNEVRQKLDEVRPQNLGQAGRIPGVTPAALSLLLVHLKQRAA